MSTRPPRTVQEWRDEIEKARPRDGDLIAVALKRLTDLHLEMLEELAERLEAMPPTPIRVSIRAPASRFECHRVRAGGDACDPNRTGVTWGDACPACRAAWSNTRELGPLPKHTPAKGRARDLRLANALELIEAMPCVLASSKPRLDDEHHAGDGRFACLELRVSSPCATCIAHEALES